MGFSLSKSAKTFLFVLFISLAGVSASYWGYQKSLAEFNFSGSNNIVGYLSESNNLIEKRPTKRLLWYPLKTGESVYKGDTIRSSEDGRGVVFLSEVGLKLELEPGTLIQLNLAEQKMSLELLTGGFRYMNPFAVPQSKTLQSNIVVDGNKLEITGQKQDGFVLKTSDGTHVNVTDGALDLKGTLKITSDGSVILAADKNIDETTDLVKIISPRIDKIYATRKSKKITIPFDVIVPEGIERSDIVFYTGKSINKLKPTKLDRQKFSKGTYLFAVKSKSSGEFLSSVSRFSVAEIADPIALYPEAQSTKYLDPVSKEIEVRFEWIGKDVSDLSLEMANDYGFQNIHKRFDLAGRSALRVNFKKPDDFYWRITGRIGNSIVSSKINKLNILELPKPSLPTLVTEVPKSVYRWQLQQYGILVGWSNTEDADIVSFEIDDGKKKSKIEVAGRKFINLSEVLDGNGDYRFRLKNRRGDFVTDWTPYTNITVNENPSVDLSRYSAGLYYSYMDKPFAMKWDPLEKTSKKWIVNITEATSKKTRVLNIDNPQIIFTAIDNGKINISIDEVLEGEFVISKRSPKKLNIIYSEYLPPPIPKGFDEKITSNKDGSLTLDYNKPIVSFGYKVSLENNRGEIIHNNIQKSPKTSLKDLLPGSYSLSISTLNSKLESGEPHKVAIEVPNTNALKRPVIKGINVGK